MSGSPTDSQFDRLLIVRLSAMGDVIHALPAAQALRIAFPHAMIGWLIEERWAELLCAAGTPRRGPRSPQRPLVDWVHTVELTRWRQSLFTVATLQQIAKIWNDIRSDPYDLAADLQGAMRSAILASWSGTKIVYGAAEPRESPASLWYSRPVIAHGRHVVEQNFSIAKAVAGHSLEIPRAEFPRDPHAEARIDAQLARHSLRDFAILNPGAGWGAKRWPAERYGRVAAALAADGLRFVINFGPGEESLARDAEAAGKGAAVPLQCSIGELIALTRRAKLFIGGDTGPLHLAAALEIPVVAIFGPTDPVRNGPYGTRSIVLRHPESPTTHARNAQPDNAMLAITVETVAAAARALLAAREVAHG